MAEETSQNKTEAPTPRRREKAREEGQVVSSPDLVSGIVLLAFGLACWWWGPVYGELVQGIVKQSLLRIAGTSWDAGTTVLAGRWLFGHLGLLAGFVTLGALVLGVSAVQLQAGFALTFKPLAPNWEKVSPIKGWMRIWSAESLMRGVMALLKIGSSVAIAVAVGWAWYGAVRVGTRGAFAGSVHLGWELACQLMLWLGGMALVWGIGDYVFKYFRHEQKLKMSRQEVKDEQKQEQGDPHIKSRMRKMQQDAAERKTLQDVPGASAVITNPTHYAVALKYESGRMKAPRIVAKGKDAFARRIVAVAREHGVPVLERKPLTRALYALAEVGQEIPLEFYRAVAEILAHVYRLKHAG